MDRRDQTTIFQFILIVICLFIFGPTILSIFSFFAYVAIAILIVVVVLWLFGVFD